MLTSSALPRCALPSESQYLAMVQVHAEGSAACAVPQVAEHGVVLGEQALRLCALVFIALRFRSRLRFFPMWQQALAVLAPKARAAAAIARRPQAHDFGHFFG